MWHLTLHRWTGDPQQAAQRHLAAHLKWMGEQQRAGTVIAAGPTEDFELGIILFGHRSRQAVDELCRSEPFVAAGERSYEVIPWDVHHVLGIGSFEPPPTLSH